MIGWLLLRWLNSSPQVKDFLILTNICNDCKYFTKLLASKLSKLFLLVRGLANIWWPMTWHGIAWVTRVVHSEWLYTKDTSLTVLRERNKLKTGCFSCKERVTVAQASVSPKGIFFFGVVFGSPRRVFYLGVIYCSWVELSYFGQSGYYRQVTKVMTSVDFMNYVNHKNIWILIINKTNEVNLRKKIYNFKKLIKVKVLSPFYHIF